MDWTTWPRRAKSKRARQLRISLGVMLEDLDDVAGMQVCCIRKLV